MTQKPLAISRYSLKIFQECPRCFWLDKHHGIKRPEGYPPAISIAIDKLLKAEFDTYRSREELHPILHKYGIKGHLFKDLKLLSKWRNNFEGLRIHDQGLDAYLFGAVDDIIEFDDGRLAIVDYKSTGAKEITIYADYQAQMDIYSYLLEEMGYETAQVAYFAFFQVDDANGFGDRLPFLSEVRQVATDSSYVHDLFSKAVATVRNPSEPTPNASCQYCARELAILNLNK